MNNIPLSLEAQFDLALLKLHLREYPEQAEEIALKQFQFHLEASAKCQRLQTKYDRLRTEQSEILQQNVHLRQAKHNLVRENQQLRRENQNLMQLINTLTQESSPLPDFLPQVLDC